MRRATNVVSTHSLRVVHCQRLSICTRTRQVVFTFKKGRPLSAVIYLDPDKTSSVWATHYGSDSTWTISIGNVMLYDIGQKDMTKLIKAIEEEMEEKNVTSDDSA